MRHHLGQKRMPKPLSFSKFLNAVIENICKVADSFVIRISGTKDIGAITNLRIERMRTDLKCQMGGIREMTAFRFDFLKFRRAVYPNRFQSCTVINFSSLVLGCAQQHARDVSVVMYGDAQF